MSLSEKSPYSGSGIVAGQRLWAVRHEALPRSGAGAAWLVWGGAAGFEQQSAHAAQGERGANGIEKILSQLDF